MGKEGFSASLTWPCPQRASVSRHLKNIPTDVYEEIFTWLRPGVDPEMDLESQHKIFARLASVCRYFAHYVIREMCRCLDFDGKARFPRPRTPTGPWCTGIIKRLQPMETLRLQIKECELRDWIFFEPSEDCHQVALTFLKRFPLVLSRLDNLRVLTLSRTPISYFLLQTVGRLRTLEQLVIFTCYIDDLQDHHPKETIFGIHETPFPALHQLTIANTNPRMEAVFKDAFCALASVTTLRSLVINNSFWLRFLLPHISPHLVSLEGNFSAISLDAFHQFIKAHTALKDLAIHCRECESYPSGDFSYSGYSAVQGPCIFPYATFDLDRTDLPDLRSFNGPLNLTPKFIRSRPVSRLAIGSYLPTIGLRFPMLDPRVPLIVLHGLTEFLGTDGYFATENWHDYRLTRDDSNDVWDDLKPIGGGIQELFVRFDGTTLPVKTLSSCFPNLVRLQLELYWEDETDPGYDTISQEVFLENLAEDLKDFNHLKLLSLCGLNNTLLCWLSPGDQHNFVHRVFHNCYPTLMTVVFGPLMVWHLRIPPLKLGECHCELELLSPSTLRQELRELGEQSFYTKRVRDWKGKITDLFNRDLRGLGGILWEP